MEYQSMPPPHDPLDLRSHGELMRLVQEGNVLLQRREDLIQERDVRIQRMGARIEELKRRVDWFERQLFGSKSERRALQGVDARQLFLGEMLETQEDPPAPGTTVKTYERSQRRNPTKMVETDSRLKFGPGVPIQVIEVPNPEIEGLGPEEYEVIEERHQYYYCPCPEARGLRRPEVRSKGREDQAPSRFG